MAALVRLPSVLAIMGGVLVAVSMQSSSVRYYDGAFMLGAGMIMFGIIAWTLIQIYNYLRIMEARHIKLMKLKKASDTSQPSPSFRGKRLR